MKAYYNGITLEGTPEEVAQCIKVIQEQGITAPNTLRKAIDNIYEYADRSVTAAKLSGPVLTEKKIAAGHITTTGIKDHERKRRYDVGAGEEIEVVVPQGSVRITGEGIAKAEGCKYVYLFDKQNNDTD